MMCEVICLNCHSRHILTASLASLYGPVIHVYCPICRKKTIKNFSTYVWAQVQCKEFMDRYEQVSVMITLGRMIERKLT